MIDEKIFRNVLNTLKERPEMSRDILDSFSDNQFKTKLKLVEKLSNYIDKSSEIAILGCWFGSILIPYLAPKVKKVIALDLDDAVVRVGKNKLYPHLENVSWSTGDVFSKVLDYSNVNCVVNTSCEHMKPMKEWQYWNKNSYFAVTSNNMTNIEGHINCVNSIEELINQMPSNSKILEHDTIEDSRGQRFLLIGKII